jgi:hypothetical protein
MENLPWRVDEIKRFTPNDDSVGLVELCTVHVRNSWGRNALQRLEKVSLAYATRAKYEHPVLPLEPRSELAQQPALDCVSGDLGRYLYRYAFRGTTCHE